MEYRIYIKKIREQLEKMSEVVLYLQQLEIMCNCCKYQY